MAPRFEEIKKGMMIAIPYNKMGGEDYYYFEVTGTSTIKYNKIKEDDPEREDHFILIRKLWSDRDAECIRMEPDGSFARTRVNQKIRTASGSEIDPEALNRRGVKFYSENI